MTRSAVIGRPPLRLRPLARPKIDNAGLAENAEEPDEAVAEPVDRHRELHRHERPALSVRGFVVAEVITGGFPATCLYTVPLLPTKSSPVIHMMFGLSSSLSRSPGS
jgi:hypothetical protein